MAEEEEEGAAPLAFLAEEAEATCGDDAAIRCPYAAKVSGAGARSLRNEPRVRVRVRVRDRVMTTPTPTLPYSVTGEVSNAREVSDHDLVRVAVAHHEAATWLGLGLRLGLG